MAKTDVKLIKNLREETGAPIVRVKKVLEEVDGSKKRAFEILQKEGFEKAAKKEGRKTEQGVVATYLHHSQKVASLVEIMCETDFVAKNELFQTLAHNLALQVASMDPKSTKELFDQQFIKDPKRTVSDLVKEVIAKTGENVRVGRIFRVELGKE